MDLEDLLKKWNADLLADEGIEDVVDPDHLEAKWLGRPPATEAAIAAAEKRLGVGLPPSYRRFLLAANGWVYPGNDMDFPGALRAVEDIGWFKDEDPEWVDTWMSGDHQEVSDEDYFVYGEEQDPVNLRVEYLDKCLLVSDASEGGVYLLNSAVVGKDGEWEAWHFSNELPGATRARSFAELIAQQREQLLQYRE